MSRISLDPLIHHHTGWGQGDVLSTGSYASYDHYFSESGCNRSAGRVSWGSHSMTRPVTTFATREQLAVYKNAYRPDGMVLWLILGLGKPPRTMGGRRADVKIRGPRWIHHHDDVPLHWTLWTRPLFSWRDSLHLQPSCECTASTYPTFYNGLSIQFDFLPGSFISPSWAFVFSILEINLCVRHTAFFFPALFLSFSLSFFSSTLFGSGVGSHG